MKQIGLVRIGNEPVLRYTAGEKPRPVLNLSLAYPYGQKAGDGKRPTQWIEARLWGDHAEKLQPYLTKGSLILAELSDVHIEQYESNGNTRFKLVANLMSVGLTGNKNGAGEQPSNLSVSSDQYQRAKDGSPSKPASLPSQSFDDFENDIPF